MVRDIAHCTLWRDNVLKMLRGPLDKALFENEPEGPRDDESFVLGSPDGSSLRTQSVRNGPPVVSELM